VAVVVSWEGRGNQGSVEASKGVEAKASVVVAKAVRSVGKVVAVRVTEIVGVEMVVAAWGREAVEKERVEAAMVSVVVARGNGVADIVLEGAVRVQVVERRVVAKMAEGKAAVGKVKVAVAWVACWVARAPQ